MVVDGDWECGNLELGSNGRKRRKASVNQESLLVGLQLLRHDLQSAGHGRRFATTIPGVPVNAGDLLSVFLAVSQACQWGGLDGLKVLQATAS